MSAIESVMARMLPIRSFRKSDLLSLCAVFLAAVCTTHIGYTQSALMEVSEALVRVNITTEIRGAGNALEFRKHLLDEYNPIFIQNFSSTGIVLDRRDHVMTFLGVGKYFIPDHDTQYEIVTSEGRRFKGELIGIDRGNGTAVIQVPADNAFRKTLVCVSCQISDGSIVLAPVKGPSGVRFQEARVISTELNMEMQGQNVWKIRMDRPFLDERQPLLTTDRQVLGFIEKDDPSSVWNNLYPISELLSSAEKIAARHGNINDGYLGIISDNYRSDSVSGVIIKSVTDDSPAQKAGLAVSDIVLQYNGRSVGNLDRFIRLVQSTPIGSDVRIRILRNGEPADLNARIEERKLPQPMDFMLRNLQNMVNANFGGIFPREGMPSRMNPFGFDAVVLTPEFADTLRIRRQSGILIYNLVKQTPADLAGIRNGDVIVSVNEKPFSDTAELFSYLQSLHSGSKVTIKIDRNGTERVVSFQLPDRKQ